MRSVAVTFFAFVFGLLFLGCPKPQPGPQPPLVDADAATLGDAGLGDARPLCVRACTALAQVPCPHEADDAHFSLCLRACEQSEEGEGVVPFLADCILKTGHDVVKLRADCNVRCLP